MTLWCLFARDYGHLLSQDKQMSRHGIICQGWRGVSIPAGLAWYEFTFRMDEGPESYANCMSEKGTDNPGGEGVESIFLLERRIYVVQAMWCNPC